nr:polyprotein [Bat picornavirus BtSY1]
MMVYGDNIAKMPVVSKSQKTFLEVLHSKTRRQCLTITRQTWLVTPKGSKLLNERVVYKSSSIPKLVYNCGVSASRVDSGSSKHYAQAGGNLTMINYYGQHYSKADGSAATVMDPEKFTKPIEALGSIAGPALKSPNVEEAGYSDRIIQITSGNSTITSQEAAAAVVGYGQWPEYDEGVGEAMDAQTKPGPSCDRFYTFESIKWTSDWQGFYYRFPACLSDLGVFGQNCQYHFLFRGGYCVHVQVNASKFHQGLLLVAVVPEMQLNHTTNNPWEASTALTAADHATLGVSQLTLFPHQFINLRTNNSATIVMPYTNCSPAENPLTHSTSAIVIIPLSPLAYSPGATTYVPITTSVAPMASSFSGLRTSVAIPHKVPRTQGIPVFDVPGSAQFMTTLKNDGYPAYPNFDETPAHQIPGEVTNLLEVCQVDTICDASDGDGAFAYRFDVSGQSIPGQRIRAWDLSMNSKLLASTYLGRCTKWYTHYRGSINLTFLYTGSAMSTGKLLIAYTPPGASGAPTNRTDAMLATHAIWDIGLQSSFSFVVPFVSQSQYRYTGDTDHVFGYDGWVSVFYQTNIIVPPGAPTTTSVVVLASATKNFVMRLATDSAYFQGIGDKLGKVITNTTETALQNVLTSATETVNALPPTLSIQHGDAAALTAVETGASASTEAAQMMETRIVPVKYSGAETDLNCFLSRYAAFSRFTIKVGSGTAHMRVPLEFADTNTHRAIKAKYRMFTYIRCGYDVVAVSSARNSTSSAGLKFQMMFVPPGAPKPTARDSDEWYVPTTPSVYADIGGTPASMRIPFMGVSTAFASRYDGFPGFDPSIERYGQFVGNYIGDLYVRTIANASTASTTTTLEADFILYARPTMIRAWIPRPIISLKPTVFLDASRGRFKPVSHETDTLWENPEAEDHEIPQWTQTSDALYNSGPKRKKGTISMFRPCGPWQQIGTVPWHISDLLMAMPLVDFGNGEFHAIALSPNSVLVPYHLLGSEMRIRDDIFDRSVPCSYTMRGCSLTQDYAILELDADWCRRATPLCLECHPENGWTACHTPGFQMWRRTGSAYKEESIFVNEPQPHTQTHLYRCSFPIPRGYCGSPLICDHHRAVIGFASVSSSTSSWFQRLSDVYDLQAMEQGPAEEQGLTDWLTGLARDLGGAFGDGTVDAVRDQARRMCLDAGIQLPKTEMAKEIVNLLVKSVCACVLISKSEDKASTAAALGVMLGVDLLVHSPFDWLQEQVNKALGCIVREQGPITDWVKDFNAACQAAKSLEWIGHKVSEFVEWVKKLFAKEEPRRRRFMQLLEDFPDMMESIDKVSAARGKYTDEQVRKLCENMKNLKKGADIYGVERAFACQQISKYYQKALTLIQGMSTGRHEPVAVLIHGSPGTGKSLATEIIGRCLTTKMGGHRPYSLPPDPKHFDGYAQQPVVIMDDVGQNPDGEDLKLFCQMVSSTEFIVPMAALEEKGMAFTSQFVLASTNCADLNPPTIAEPKALNRRFFMDLNIELNKEFSYKGKITADQALNQCDHPSANFPKCCPIICGQAMRFLDRRDGVRYSVDEVVTRCLREQKARACCGSKIDAIFQGSDDDWFQTDYDRESNVLKTIDEQVAEGIVQEKPTPKEIADLLRAVPSDDVVHYCRRQGWIIPADVTYRRVRDAITPWLTKLATGLSIVASVASIAGFVWMMYRIFASCQGAYTGGVTQVMKKPELRRVAKVQGPEMEFATKLMNQSLFDVRTSRGHFTGLGIYDKWILLPKHSRPGDSIELEGKEFQCLDIVELENTQGSLELVCVKIDRPTNFRDIRKYIPEAFTTERECHLVINNENYRRMFCPVGAVTCFGFLNLSGNATYQTCTYRYPTKSGQCGGVICKAGKIIAMHIGGDGASGYGAILKRSMFTCTQGQITKTEKAPRSVNLNSRSQLHPSVFHDIFPGSKEPAALHPKDKRLEVDLEEAMFGKYKGNVGAVIDPEVLLAVDHYTEQIRPLMPDNLTEPLSLEDVVYGVENLEGLDLNTSAGYPYNTLGIRKRDLVPEKGQPLTRLTDALDLHGYDLPFTTYLKDELRPIKKIKAGKTRLIECSSLNDTIRMKRVFGRLFQVFHQNPGTVTGSAVGCNPDFHWSKFYAEMGGNPLVAFDYSNFDASMEPMWFDATKLVLQKLGYTDEHLKCIDHIKSSEHIYKDKLYHVEGGMPSGCSGTSIFNSINNNLIIRTLVLKAYKGIDLDSLKIIAYGDDVVAAYPYQLDAQTLADEGKNYGLTMTPPDKDSSFNETNWDNVTFLKRRFVPDREFPFLIHPVFPMSEIHESIRWTRSAANTQDHVRSLCLLAWHAGEDTYNEFLGKIRTTPVGRALQLPAYSVLRHAWLELF